MGAMELPAWWPNAAAGLGAAAACGLLLRYLSQQRPSGETAPLFPGPHAEGQVIREMRYAIELHCGDTDTRHFRHITTKGKECLATSPPVLKEEVLKGRGTIPRTLALIAEEYGSMRCMGTRPIIECTFEGKKQYWTKGPYEWRTYREVYSDVREAASGLAQLEAVARKKKEGTQCIAALLAETSAEWQISAHACFQCGLAVTTVYTTLGHDAMIFGLSESGASLVFVDWAQFRVLKDKVIAKCPSIKHVVLIGKALTPLAAKGGEVQAFPSAQEASGLGEGCHFDVAILDALIALGASKPVDLEPLAPKTEDLAIIMYTSGSTGNPKGVMLTHGNFIAAAGGIIAQGAKFGHEDVYMAYLPLAHIMELVVEYIAMCKGTVIGYGHPRSLTASSVCVPPWDPASADLPALRPTLLAAVPAVLDAIKNGLQMKLKTLPGFPGRLLRTAVCHSQGLPGGDGLLASVLMSVPPLRAMLLKKLRGGIGLENIRFLFSGGAPLAPETQAYISGAIAPVCQGYSSTEMCGVFAIHEAVQFGDRKPDHSVGTVGAVCPCSELKLKSVPDMGYFVTDDPPRGEILASGNNIAHLGYFNMKEKTKEDFPKDAEGKVWFQTGDIGVFTDLGQLKIVDRKKDLIKLSGGEYVSLGKVEAGLMQVPGIGAAIVFAQSNKDYCVAIVSQPEKGWASVGGKPEEKALVAAIGETLRKMGFARFEIPTKAKLDDKAWTPETGLVTASFKVQRNNLRAYYSGPGGLLEAMDYTFPSA